MSNEAISLANFVDGCPEAECVKCFYTSVGIPAGEEIVLGDPGYETPFDDLDVIMGALDGDGIWRWDGEGDPTDFNRNTVMRVDAWYDHTNTDEGEEDE